MPQRILFVVIKILVFDFEFFIGERSFSWLTGSSVWIFFPIRFNWEFDCFAVVRCSLDKYNWYYQQTDD